VFLWRLPRPTFFVDKIDRVSTLWTWKPFSAEEALRNVGRGHMMISQIQNRLIYTILGGLMLFASDPAHAQDDAVKAASTISGVVQWADGVSANETTAHLHRWDSDRLRWMTEEQSSAVDKGGAFQFDELPGDQYWCVAVRAPGAGTVGAHELRW